MPKPLQRTGLPTEFTSQLSEGENVYFFSPLETQGGCLGFGSSSGNFWVGLTDKRVLYHAKVKEGNSYFERDGILLLKNISSLEISETQLPGCLGTSILAPKSWELRINAQGGIIGLPFANKEKGNEMRSIYHELTQT
jgi:hypothetical protein